MANITRVKSWVDKEGFAHVEFWSTIPFIEGGFFRVHSVSESVDMDYYARFSTYNVNNVTYSENRLYAHLVFSLYALRTKVSFSHIVNDSTVQLASANIDFFEQKINAENQRTDKYIQNEKYRWEYSESNKRFTLWIFNRNSYLDGFNTYPSGKIYKVNHEQKTKEEIGFSNGVFYDSSTNVSRVEFDRIGLYVKPNASDDLEISCEVNDKIYTAPISFNEETKQLYKE